MLASRLDDVIDLLDGTSRRFEMLHISDVQPRARQLTNVLCPRDGRDPGRGRARCGSRRR